MSLINVKKFEKLGNELGEFLMSKDLTNGEVKLLLRNKIDNVNWQQAKG